MITSKSLEEKFSGDNCAIATIILSFNDNGMLTATGNTFWVKTQ